MSRIGNAPINIPAGVSVSVKDSTVSVEAKGITLTQKVSDGINVEIIEGVSEGDEIKVWNKALEENNEEEDEDDKN